MDNPGVSYVCPKFKILTYCDAAKDYGYRVRFNIHYQCRNSSISKLEGKLASVAFFFLSSLTFPTSLANEDYNNSLQHLFLIKSVISSRIKLIGGVCLH